MTKPLHEGRPGYDCCEMMAVAEILEGRVLSGAATEVQGDEARDFSSATSLPRTSHESHVV